MGHLPREISRPTKFLLDRGAEIVAEIESSYYRRFPLIQAGLEIRCKVSATLPGTIKNHMLLDRYKELEPTTATTAGSEESKPKKKN